jgi:S-DNA-T family DNA segregation ATPase FtsK/SpoIIIE
MGILKRGPALGVIFMGATQRPDAKSLPLGVSANALIRYCLKVMGYRENDMVLGDGMSNAGYKAQLLSPEEKGIGYLGGVFPKPVVTRTYPAGWPPGREGRQARPGPPRGGRHAVRPRHWRGGGRA